MKRLARISRFFIKLFVAYICAFFIKLFDKSKRNIWIISERGDDARDNGYFFYKYMVTEHPEQPIFYVINSSSADFPKIQQLGKWVEFGSFRHYLYYALCTVRISAHAWGGDLPCADYFHKLRKYLRKKKKFVFLKHGIIKDYLPRHCSVSCNPDIYICGAKPEYDYVSSSFGHPEGVVRYTGLARFDNLHDVQTKRQILVMPTFRRWLQGKTSEEVADSEYARAYNALLHDERLIRALEENGLELIFYPHYVMQKYADLFSAGSERIRIAKFKDYDVQQLLIESKLLVTDFSSVFFDFGYMDKPVIYYQFDRERYVREHYDFTKGYFSYDRDGFGEVVFDGDALVNSICKIIGAGFEIEDTYKARIDEFFPIKDKHNCDRIYDTIMRLYN